MAQFNLIFSCLVPLTMIVAGYIMVRWPPAHINGLVGYRTPRSMQSDAAWKFANQYWGRIAFRWGIVILAGSVAVWAVLPYNPIALLGNVGVQMVLMVCTIIPVEKKLKEKFRNPPD